MNILFVSSEYPPETGHGGIGTYTRIMAHALVARGHAVDVISKSETGKPYTHQDGPVRLFRTGPGTFPLPQGRFFYPYRKFCYRTIYDTLVRKAFSSSVRNMYMDMARSRTYDVIECAECGAEGFFLKEERRKIVVRLHTPWSMAARLDHLGLGRLDLRALEKMERGFTRRAAGVSSPTNSLSKALMRRWGLRKVTSYPNPFDAENFPIRNGSGENIVYTGRVEYRKGVHVLIKAYAKLVESGFSNRLVLAGAPYGALRGKVPYEKVIEELIQKHNLGKRVEWIKKADRGAIRAILSNAAVAVYPSVWENYPYTCLEAMGSGVPVLAARCGGYPEMITEFDSGLLFTPLDSEDLAEHLRALLSDPEAASTMGQKGRERVGELCAPSRIAAIAESFYREAING